MKNVFHFIHLSSSSDKIQNKEWIMLKKSHHNLEQYNIHEPIYLIFSLTYE